MFLEYVKLIICPQHAVNSNAILSYNSICYFSKGPSINDVGPFSQIYDLPSPLRRRRLWMAPNRKLY